MADHSGKAFLRVRNWERFQHYRDGRSLTWIKLYLELRDRWSHLPDAHKAHIIGCWLLAPAVDNRIPADAEWIGQRIGATEYVDLRALVGPNDGEGWLESHPDTPGAVAAILATAPYGAVKKSVRRGEKKRERGEGIGSVGVETQTPTDVPSKQTLPFNGIVADACDDWTTRFKGPSPGGKLAAALAKLFHPVKGRAAIFNALEWPERVRPSWRRYLRGTEGRFADPHRFVDTFGDWDVGVTQPEAVSPAFEWPDDPAAVSAWDRVLAAVRALVIPTVFATWFRPTVGAALHGQQLVIRVPNEQFRKWVIGNHTDVLVQAQRAAGTNYALTFEFEPPRAAAEAAS